MGTNQENQQANQTNQENQNSNQQVQIQNTNTGLEFIPESYRESGWAKKYSTADDFFKGIDNMAKLVGQKQIIQGISLPGEDATEDQMNDFYSKIGRPESADKYVFDESKLPEGIDYEAEKKSFSDIAYKIGLTSKQTKELFNVYSDQLGQKLSSFTQKAQLDGDTALKEAFGDKIQDGLGLAKKGAHSLGIADKLDEEGLSFNPTVLKMAAKLGELLGEDTIISPASSGSIESELQEALKLQKSPEYLAGDKATHARVAAAYKRAYG